MKDQSTYFNFSKSFNDLDFDKPDTIKTIMKELSNSEPKIERQLIDKQSVDVDIISQVQNEYKEDAINKIYKLIKFFEKKTNLSNILNFIIKSKDVEENVSISSSKMVIHFFYIILNYYLIHDFELDYNDTNFNEETKIKIIEKALNKDMISNEISLKIFNLIDFMFNQIKNVLTQIKNGFWILNECVDEDFINKTKCGDINVTNTLNYEKTIFPELDMLFYITFMFMFPTELKTQLKNELIISDCEYNILEKCKSMIIKNQSKISVCSVTKNICSEKVSQSNTEPVSFLSKIFKKEEKDYVELNSVSGILMLLSIFVKLRPFNKRRKSKS